MLLSSGHAVSSGDGYRGGSVFIGFSPHKEVLIKRIANERNTRCSVELEPDVVADISGGRFFMVEFR
jgi:hypothetical protein